MTTQFSAPVALPADAASPAARPARGPHAAETRRLYAGDWAGFVAWCRSAGRASLPADADTVERYVASLASTLGRGALDRRLAAIAQAHRARKISPPTDDAALRRRLRALKRQFCAAPRRPPQPARTTLVRMAETCPDDRAGLRDRALLLLAAAGLGRAALVGLDAEQVGFAADRVELTIAGAGPGRGGTVVVARDATVGACPVRALERWLRRSDTRFGPVFRKVDRWGNVEHRRLGSDAIRRILARRQRPLRQGGQPGQAA